MFKYYSNAVIIILVVTFANTAVSDQCEKIVPLYDKISQETLLEFTKEVPCAEKNKTEVKDYLVSIFKKQLPDIKLKHESLLLKSLNLIPYSFDYKSNLLGLYEEQIAGYYDPHEKSYSIADWIPKEMQLPVAMHELTHVLQDQNFDLLKFSTPDMTTDQSLARAAIVEGDATYTMYNMLRKATGQVSLEKSTEIDSLVQAIKSQTSSSINSNDVPEFLKHMIIFPYANGLKYIFTKRKQESRPTADSFFKNPPNYTSEILHPDIPGVTENIVKNSCPSRSTMKNIYEDRFGEFFYETNLIGLSNEIDERGWNGDIACIFADSKNSQKLAYFSSDWLNKDKHQAVVKYFKKISNSRILNETYPVVEVEIPIVE